MINVNEKELEKKIEKLEVNDSEKNKENNTSTSPEENEGIYNGQGIVNTEEEKKDLPEFKLSKEDMTKILFTDNEIRDDEKGKYEFVSNFTKVFNLIYL